MPRTKSLERPTVYKRSTPFTHPTTRAVWPLSGGDMQYPGFPLRNPYRDSIPDGIRAKSQKTNHEYRPRVREPRSLTSLQTCRVISDQRSPHDQEDSRVNLIPISFAENSPCCSGRYSVHGVNQCENTLALSCSLDTRSHTLPVTERYSVPTTTRLVLAFSNLL